MSYDYNALVSQIASCRRQVASTFDNNDDDGKKDDEAKMEEEELARIEQLDQAVDTFSTLSKKCPMTPLLWMQYASDTRQLLEMADDESPSETRLQLLEVALEEYPGSAILHLHYLQLLLRSVTVNNNDEKMDQKIIETLDNALRLVGQGSHRNEGEIIVSIYRLHATYHMSKGRFKDALESFYQRAGIPIKDANDSLVQELQEFLISSNSSTEAGGDLLHRIELNRRNESRLYRDLVTWEDEVDVAMHTEGILSRHQMRHHIRGDGDSHYDDLDWDKLLLSDGKTYWMGLGGLSTANSFINYAQACCKHGRRISFQRRRHDDYDDKDNNDMEDAKKLQSLALSVYERGVAECPTIETIWLSYIRHLVSLCTFTNNSNDDNTITTTKTAKKIYDYGMLTLIQSVVSRSVRNCPYSVKLFQQKLHAYYLLVEAGRSIFDPDELIKIVQEALDEKFITSPSACLELYMTTIQIVRRHILSLLSSSAVTTITMKGKKNKGDKKAAAATTTEVLLDYDDAEPFLNKDKPTSSSRSEVDEGTEQTIQDLCEDIREIYESIDSYLRKNHTSYSEGRSLLWLDKAQTETYIVGPLMTYFGQDEAMKLNESQSKMFHQNKAETTIEAGIRCFEKLIKIQQPAHPDSFLPYVQSFLISTSATSITTPTQIISKIRQLRGLFQKAFLCVAKPKKQQQEQENVTTLDGVSTTSNRPRDFDTALDCLSHEYLVFERTFGSESSYNQAYQSIQKKLQKMCTTTGNDGSNPINNSSIVGGLSSMIGQETNFYEQSNNNNSSSANEASVTQSQISKTKEETKDVHSSSKDQSSDMENNSGQKDTICNKRKLDDEERIDNADTVGLEKEDHLPSKRSKVSSNDVEANVDTNNNSAAIQQDGVKMEVTTELETSNKAGTNEMAVSKLEDDKKGGSSSVSKISQQNSSEQQTSEKPQTHKVRIGNLDYKTHPYTIRVSNLTNDTEDMDLVDTFRPRCGAIVHAKIMREKHHHQNHNHHHHHHAKSKGWGLVQFEERDSVEQAIKLSNEIGIHDQLITIDRSHMPAVTLVPPGMHRVNPKGTGKSTKRNLKRKEMRQQQEEKTEKEAVTSTSTNANTTSPEAAKDNTKQQKTMSLKKGASVLSFRPRGVGRTNRKVKLSFSSPSSSGPNEKKK